MTASKRRVKQDNINVRAPVDDRAEPRNLTRDVRNETAHGDAVSIGIHESGIVLLLRVDSAVRSRGVKDGPLRGDLADLHLRRLGALGRLIGPRRSPLWR